MVGVILTKEIILANNLANLPRELLLIPPHRIRRISETDSWCGSNWESLFLGLISHPHPGFFITQTLKLLLSKFHCLQEATLAQGPSAKACAPSKTSRGLPDWFLITLLSTNETRHCLMLKVSALELFNWLGVWLEVLKCSYKILEYQQRLGLLQHTVFLEFVFCPIVLDQVSRMNYQMIT